MDNSSASTGASSFATVDEMKSLFSKLRMTNDAQLQGMKLAHDRKMVQSHKELNERFLSVQLLRNKAREELNGSVHLDLMDVHAKIEKQDEEFCKQFVDINLCIMSWNSYCTKVVLLTDKLIRNDPKEEQQILEDSMNMLNECPVAVQHIFKVALKHKPEPIDNLVVKNPEAMTRIGEGLMEKNHTAAKKMIEEIYEREDEKGSNWSAEELARLGAVAIIKIGCICLLGKD